MSCAVMYLSYLGLLKAVVDSHAIAVSHMSKRPLARCSMNGRLGPHLRPPYACGIAHVRFLERAERATGTIGDGGGTTAGRPTRNSVRAGLKTDRNTVLGCSGWKRAKTPVQGGLCLHQVMLSAYKA